MSASPQCSQYYILYIIYDIWYMIYDIWYMIYDIWYMIYDIWYIIYYILYIIYYIIYIIYYILYIIYYILYIILQINEIILKGPLSTFIFSKKRFLLWGTSRTSLEKCLGLINANNWCGSVYTPSFGPPEWVCKVFFLLSMDKIDKIETL